MLKLVSTKKEIKKINKKYGYYIEVGKDKDIISIRYANEKALIEIVNTDNDELVILNEEEVLCWESPSFIGEEGFTQYKGIKIWVNKLLDHEFNVKITL